MDELRYVEMMDYWREASYAEEERMKAIDRWIVADENKNDAEKNNADTDVKKWVESLDLKMGAFIEMLAEEVGSELLKRFKA